MCHVPCAVLCRPCDLHTSNLVTGRISVYHTITRRISGVPLVCASACLNFCMQVRYTRRGLAYADDWGTLRNAANSALLALVYARHDPAAAPALECWAQSQLRRAPLPSPAQPRSRRPHIKCTTCRKCRWCAAVAGS